MFDVDSTQLLSEPEVITYTGPDLNVETAFTGEVSTTISSHSAKTKVGAAGGRRVLTALIRER